jgi:uncharacterized damage-inducible protein DinB
MTQAQILAKRLQEVLLNGTWIANTNFKARITALNHEEASRKVLNLNSVAALTFHVNYYLKGILDAVEKGELTIRDKFSFDIPPIESAADWQALIDDFLDNANKFVQFVNNLDDDALKLDFFNEKYGSYQRNIEGVIEHAYYHLGQISLITKLLKNPA